MIRGVTIWAEAEKEYLRKHYRSDGAAACAATLGKTKAQVYDKASELGLSTQRAWDRAPRVPIGLPEPKPIEPPKRHPMLGESSIPPIPKRRLMAGKA